LANLLGLPFLKSNKFGILKCWGEYKKYLPNNTQEKEQNCDFIQTARNYLRLAKYHSSEQILHILVTFLPSFGIHQNS
jgi:hypothetical protein